METALQELIKQIEQKINMFDYENEIHRKTIGVYRDTINMARELFETERKTILYSFKKGEINIDFDALNGFGTKTNAELFYDFHFNNKQHN